MRHVEHGDDDDEAVDDKAIVLQRPQDFGQQRQRHRARDRPERRTYAAKNRKAEDRHRRVEAIVVRADRGGGVGVERAGEAGEHGRGDERRHFIARKIDAADGRGDLILPDRLHGAADARAADQDQRQHGEEETSVNQRKPGFDRNAGKAERAAGQIRLDEENPQDFAKADRRQREIDARKAQRRHADRECHSGGRQHGGGENEREGQAGMEGKQGRGVGPDAHERRLSERQLADRQHDIHAQRQKPVDAERDEQALVGPEEIVEVEASHQGNSLRLMAAMGWARRRVPPGIVASRISGKFVAEAGSRGPRAACGGRRGRPGESQPKRDRWALGGSGVRCKGVAKRSGPARENPRHLRAGRSSRPGFIYVSPAAKVLRVARRASPDAGQAARREAYCRTAARRIEQAGSLKMSNAAKLIELDERIAAIRENIRELTEQAAAYSGAEDESRTADRIAEEEAQLAALLKQREALGG